jgi:hypothetical protein
LDHAALVAVFDQFAAMDRYSHQRDEILDQLVDHTYACEIEFGSSERTYGYTPDDRFRDGRTVIGILKGSSHKVSLQMPSDQNDRVEGFGSGDTVQQAAVFMSWSSIYDRFELQADPVASVVQQQGREEKVVEPEAPPSPATEPVSSETVAEAKPVAEPSGREPSLASTTPVEQPTREAVSESDSPEAPAAPVATTPGLGRLSAEDRNAFLDVAQPLTSASLIDFLATGLQLQVQQVTAVVDGFWGYVLQPEHFGHQKKVIPNFGTFSLATEQGQPTLVFQSKSTRQLVAQQSKGWNHLASERWIRYYQAKSDSSDLSGLSVKRRMSVWIAERTGESLTIVHRVLWELMSLVCDLMAEGKRSIRWAMRGEMFPHEVQLKGEDEPQMRYGFRTYGRLSKKLVVPVSQQVRTSATAAASVSGGLKNLFNPANYFQGPGTLRQATVGEGTSAGSNLKNWFSLRWWGIPLVFVLCLNMISWPYSPVGSFSLQAFIFNMTFTMPLVLSLVFGLLAKVLLSATGRPSDQVLVLIFRFFAIMSVLIGLLGFVIAVVFRCLDWLSGLVA